MSETAYLEAMRAGASFDRDCPELLALHARGLCTRHVLAGAPDAPLYYVTHTCGECGTTSVGRAAREPLCERCDDLRRNQRANALGARPSVFNIPWPSKEAPGHG